MELSNEHRQDLLLRSLVQRCREVLEPHGFQIDARTHTPSCDWVRFYGPSQTQAGPDSVYVLLVAHALTDSAVLADLRLTDLHLDIQTPAWKWLHRYDEHAAPLDTAAELSRQLHHLLSGAARCGHILCSKPLLVSSGAGAVGDGSKGYLGRNPDPAHARAECRGARGVSTARLDWRRTGPRAASAQG